MLDANKTGGTINAANSPSQGCNSNTDPQALNAFWAAS